MNLYSLSQSDNGGYDTYDSCVVAAISPKKAVLIHPYGTKFESPMHDWKYGDWANSPESVDCEYIGKAKVGTKEGVICASFNAG